MYKIFLTEINLNVIAYRVISLIVNLNKFKHLKTKNKNQQYFLLYRIVSIRQTKTLTHTHTHTY